MSHTVSLKEIAEQLISYKDGHLPTGNLIGLTNLIVEHCQRSEHKEHIRDALKRAFDDLIESRTNNNLCGND